MKRERSKSVETKYKVPRKRPYKQVDKIIINKATVLPFLKEKTSYENQLLEREMILRENSLRNVLNEINLWQYSELLKYFSAEIKNAETYKYFHNINNILMHEEKEKLVNTLIFYIWSSKFFPSNYSRELSLKIKYPICKENSFSFNKSIPQKFEETIHEPKKYSPLHFSQNPINQINFGNSKISFPTFCPTESYETEIINSVPIKNCLREESRIAFSEDNTNFNHSPLFSKNSHDSSSGTFPFNKEQFSNGKNEEFPDDDEDFEKKLIQIFIEPLQNDSYKMLQNILSKANYEVLDNILRHPDDWLERKEPFYLLLKDIKQFSYFLKIDPVSQKYGILKRKN
jgi:hypothetical protein